MRKENFKSAFSCRFLSKSTETTLSTPVRPAGLGECSRGDWSPLEIARRASGSCVSAETLAIIMYLKTEQCNFFHVSGLACFIRRSSPRAISTSQLHTLLRFHTLPINQVVFLGPYSMKDERSHLRGSFTLRCFQRLSRPYIATQLCPWQDNWCTRGTSIPVLSY